MSKPSKADSVLLYLIDRAHKRLGADSVSRVVAGDNDGSLLQGISLEPAPPSASDTSVPHSADPDGFTLNMGHQIKIFVYIDAHAPRSQPAQDALISAYDPQLFGADDAMGNVSMSHKMLSNAGEADEQLYCVKLQGTVDELRHYIMKHDPEGFKAAQESHSAQEVLRREKGRGIKQRGE